MPSQALFPTASYLLENHRQCFDDFPIGVMRLHLSKVAVVANVVTNSVLIDIAPFHLSACDILDHVERFENRARVGLAASEIVDFGNSWRLPELIHEARYVCRMNVVADLLSLVSKDPVLAVFDVALHQIAEEPM